MQDYYAAYNSQLAELLTVLDFELPEWLREEQNGGKLNEAEAKQGSDDENQDYY